MTDAVILLAALLTLTIAILAVIYAIVRDAPPQEESYRRLRPWNFK